MDIVELVRFYKADIYTEKAYEEMERINGLKDYLTDYSLIKEKNIMDVYLWEKYLAYSIILGVNTNIEETLGIDFEGLKKQLAFVNEIDLNKFVL